MNGASGCREDVGRRGPAVHRHGGQGRERAGRCVHGLRHTADGDRALIVRELYLPEKWTDDRERCRAAGIGDDVAFPTKPELARRMIERAVQAGVPFAWVAGDEVYGGNPKLRAWLEDQQVPYDRRDDVRAQRRGGCDRSRSAGYLDTATFPRIRRENDSTGRRPRYIGQLPQLDLRGGE